LTLILFHAKVVLLAVKIALTLCQILVFLVNLINISIFLLVLTLALKDFSQIKQKIFALSAIPAVCN
jgi:hypothetical protein